MPSGSEIEYEPFSSIVAQMFNCFQKTFTPVIFCSTRICPPIDVAVGETVPDTLPADKVTLTVWLEPVTAKPLRIVVFADAVGEPGFMIAV